MSKLTFKGVIPIYTLTNIVLEFLFARALTHTISYLIFLIWQGENTML